MDELLADLRRKRQAALDDAAMYDHVISQLEMARSALATPVVVLAPLFPAESPPPVPPIPEQEIPVTVEIDGVRMMPQTAAFWPAERIRYVRAHYPSPATPDEMVDALNKMDGPTMTKAKLHAFAQSNLKLRRSQPLVASPPDRLDGPVIVDKPAPRIDHVRPPPVARPEHQRLDALRVVGPALTCQSITNQGVFGVGLEFCGALSERGYSYCEEHCKQYFVNWRGRRSRRPMEAA